MQLTIKRDKSVLISLFLIFLLISSLLGCSPSIRTSTPELIETSVSGILKVHYIDVGHGDCILIQAPSGKNMLIDAGNNTDADKITSYIANLGIKKLDIVVGTHPHADHIGSLDDVINTFDIGQVVMPKLIHTTRTYEDVLLAIQNKALKITSAKAGLALDLGNELSTTLVGPYSDDYDNLNDYSAVIHLTFGNTSFLFTGDAEEPSESEMVASGANLKADVLKVGHHGSSSSSTISFLNKVSPKHAVITLGKDNSYGHPHQETINKFINAGINIYRTDMVGTIIAASDGTNITFNTSPSAVKATAPAPISNQDTEPAITSTDSITVYTTDTGLKYHKEGCSYLEDIKIELTLIEAKDLELDPCGVCKP